MYNINFEEKKEGKLIILYKTYNKIWDKRC